MTGLLREIFPEEFHTSQANYFEPFVGGGALTLSLADEGVSSPIPGSRIFINDMNPDLVATYEVIRDNLEDLISSLDSIESEFKALPLPNKDLGVTESLEKSGPRDRAEYFYDVRASEPKNKIEIAARLIFLNKTCFNGLWRVNSKGQFNVPYGHHKNPSLYEKTNLEECSRRIQGSSITNLEFYNAVTEAKSGDLVYFDPPYIPLNPTSSFSQYSKNDFGLDDQRKLAKTISELTNKGVNVILSNSDTPLTREIFGDALQLRRILMSRVISASSEKRKPVYEIIGTNFPISNSSIISNLELI